MKITKEMSNYFAGLGRKSATARMEKIPARRRKAIAEKAAAARWKGHKKDGKK
jgi:hypothetical protein